MTVYTYTNARQNLARLLDEASDGTVYITRKNGQLFQLMLVEDERSGLDVPGVDSNLSAAEIVDLIREMRDAR